MADKSTPVRSSCHCGAHVLTVPSVPTDILHCQCTICRRYGAAWSYYHPDTIKFENKPDAVTKKYVWGAGTNSFNFCGTCGCVMYWWPLKPGPYDAEQLVGINTSNMNPELLRFADRKYEYSWIKHPVKSKEFAHPDDLAEYWT